ncbi:MAG TPA: hypothetical protein VJJ20_02640 [Candidatus Paceibacterota bacterium]
MWQDYANGILGLAVIGVAVFGGLDTTLAWTFGLLGAVITVIGFWGAAALPEWTAKHA